MIREEDISDTVSSDFGIDPEGPLPEEDAGTVTIPETLPPISEEDLQEFLGIVDTDTSFDDLGVQHYMDCKEYILNM